MTQRKPIIGLAGGIGSGKSTIARAMAQEGGFVIDADALAREALTRPAVRDELVAWWGDGILDDQGCVDRSRIARIVFDPRNAGERERLEALVHPIIAAERERLIAAAEADPGARFIVLDAPLLFEVGLNRSCDRVVFVEADRATRLERVSRTRGWDEAELERREKNQWGLDRKKVLSDDIIVNDASEAASVAQVRHLLSRILAKS